MANIKSAKKRILVNKRQKAENKMVRATNSTGIKKFRALIAAGDVTAAEEKLKEVIGMLNSAVSKNIIHRNNASRKIARLSALLNKAKNGGIKVEEKPVKKAPAKVSKSATAKKEVVKAEVKAAEPAVKEEKVKAAPKTEAKPATVKKVAEKTEPVKTVKKETKAATEKKAPAAKPAAEKKAPAAKKAAK